MSIYHVSFATVATAATDAHCIFEIWNPHATKRIKLLEIGVVAFAAPGAGAGFVIRRSTARGTAGSTVTPTIEHDTERGVAPPSGFLVDISAFSAQPTLAAGELGPGWVLPAVTASGIIIPIPRGITVIPGQGLCIVNRAAIAFPTCEAYVVVED